MTLTSLWRRGKERKGKESMTKRLRNACRGITQTRSVMARLGNLEGERRRETDVASSHFSNSSLSLPTQKNCISREDSKLSLTVKVPRRLELISSVF